MVGRKMKLTNNPRDRKDQRDRTQNLIEETKAMPKLQETPPRNLIGVAATTWRQVVPELNKKAWLKQTDKAVVEQLCVQVALYRDAYDHIFIGKKNKKGEQHPEGIQTPIYKNLQNNLGEIVGKDFLGYRVNPAVKTLDAATAKIKSLSETLGMTPTSRASLFNISDDDSEGPSLDDLKKAFG